MNVPEISSQTDNPLKVTTFKFLRELFSNGQVNVNYMTNLRKKSGVTYFFYFMYLDLDSNIIRVTVSGR